MNAGEMSALFHLSELPWNNTNSLLTAEYNSCWITDGAWEGKLTGGVGQVVLKMIGHRGILKVRNWAVGKAA